jgi:benzoyl-CoA 2,3-dioxygenase component B
MQLESLAQSGFDPLARTCRFMLAEEAHHMFVGTTGCGRIIQRTAEAMASAGIRDPYDVERVRALGVIDLPLIQRKMNLHFSLTLDLFGSEESTNAANYFAAGLKARYHEDSIDDDHRLHDSTYPVLKQVDGGFVIDQAPALNTLNARLRDDFVDDCLSGIGRWNREIAEHHVDFELRLPHIAFNRRVGEFAGLPVDPAGNALDEHAHRAGLGEWLPTGDDAVFVEELMQPQYDTGEFASWIARPSKGVMGQPLDFEYVKVPG